MASYLSFGSHSVAEGSDQPGVGAGAGATTAAGQPSTTTLRLLLSPTPAVAGATPTSSTESASSKATTTTLYPISPVPSHLLCAICTLPYENPVHFLPCCHVFCHECIQHWIGMTLDADDLQTELRLILDGAPSYSVRARHAAAVGTSGGGSTPLEHQQQHHREHDERYQQTLFEMGQIDSSYSRTRTTGTSAYSLLAVESSSLMDNRGRFGQGFIDDDHDDLLFTTTRDTPAPSASFGSSSSDPYTQQIRWNAILQTREMPKCPMCRTALHVQGWDRIEKRILIPTSSLAASFGHRRPFSILSPEPSSLSSPPSILPRSLSPSAGGQEQRGRTNQRTGTLAHRSGAPRGGALSRTRTSRTPRALSDLQQQQQQQQHVMDHHGGEDDGVELEQVTRRFHGRDPLSYQSVADQRVDTLYDGDDMSTPTTAIIGRRPSEWMRYQQQQMQVHQEQMEQQNRQRREEQQQAEHDHDLGLHPPASTLSISSYRLQADTMAILDRHQRQVQQLYREQQEQEALLRMLTTRALSLMGSNGGGNGETESGSTTTSDDHSIDPEITEGRRHRLSVAQPRLQIDTSSSRSVQQQQVQQQDHHQGDNALAQRPSPTQPQEASTGQDDDTPSQPESSSVGPDDDDGHSDHHSPRTHSLDNTSILDAIQQGTRAWAEEERSVVFSSNTQSSSSNENNESRPVVEMDLPAPITTTTPREAEATQQSTRNQDSDIYHQSSPLASQSSPVESELSAGSNLSMLSDELSSSLTLESSQASSAGPDSSTRPPSMGSRFSFTSSRSGYYRRDRSSQSTIQSHGLQMPLLELPLDSDGVDGEPQEDRVEHDHDPLFQAVRGDDDDQGDSSSADEISRLDYGLENSSLGGLTHHDQDDDDVVCSSSRMQETPAAATQNGNDISCEMDGDLTPTFSDPLGGTRCTTEPPTLSIVTETTTTFTGNSAGPTPLTSTVQELQVLDSTTQGSVRQSLESNPSAPATSHHCPRSPAASPLPTPILAAVPFTRARFPAGIVLNDDDDDNNGGSDSEVEAEDQADQPSSLHGELELLGYSPSDDLFSMHDGVGSSSSLLGPRPAPRVESVASVRSWMEEEERELRECIPALSLSSPLLVPGLISDNTGTASTEPDIPEPRFFSPPPTALLAATQQQQQQQLDQIAEDTPIPNDVAASVEAEAVVSSVASATDNSNLAPEPVDHEPHPVMDTISTGDEVPLEQVSADNRNESTIEPTVVISDPLDAIQSSVTETTASQPTPEGPSPEMAPEAMLSQTSSNHSPSSTEEQRPLTTFLSSTATSRPSFTAPARQPQARLTHQPRTVIPRRTTPSPSDRASEAAAPSSFHAPPPAPQQPQFRIHVRFQPKLAKAHMISDLISQVVVECPHRHHGCTETMQMQAALNHIRDTCRFRTVMCPRPRCGLQMRADQILEHVLKAEAVSAINSPVLSATATVEACTPPSSGRHNHPSHPQQGPPPPPPTSQTVSDAAHRHDGSIPSCPGLTWEREQLARATAIIAQLTEENSGLRNTMRQMGQQNAKLLKEKERWRRYENLRFC